MATQNTTSGGTRFPAATKGPAPAPAPSSGGQGPQVKDLPGILSGKRAGKAVREAPVIPILLLLVGGYLAWFGIHYWRDTQTVWPSDPVKALLQGHSLPAPSRSPSQQSTLSAVESATATTSGVGTSGGGGGSAPQGTLPAGTAQNTARLLLPRYGWGASQMAYLIPLWTDESHWSATARNPSSGAFGIAQALGHGQPGTAAPDGTNEYGAEYGLTADEARAANSGDARWQIEWGLGYIKSRYGTPQAALAHENAMQWY